MAYILNRTYYEYTKLWELRDARLSHLPFIDNSLPLFILIGAYVYFVKVGPKIMQNRKPLNIESIIIVYNFIQILFNGYFTILLWHYALKPGSNFSFKCQPVLYDDSPDSVFLVYCNYVYLMLKLLDLLDTIFFILRKKARQLSFLHVYHHVLISLGTYIAVLFAPGGQAFIVGSINTFVHTIMYSYYLWSVWKPEIKSSLAIKKSITTLQMIQFAIYVLHFGHGLVLTGNECGYPTILSFVTVAQNIFLLCLFGDFYYKNYVKSSKSTKEKLNKN